MTDQDKRFDELKAEIANVAIQQSADHALTRTNIQQGNERLDAHITLTEMKFDAVIQMIASTNARLDRNQERNDLKFDAVVQAVHAVTEQLAENNGLLAQVIVKQGETNNRIGKLATMVGRSFKDRDVRFDDMEDRVSTLETKVG